MTTNEKLCMKIVPNVGTICTICTENEATVYCRECRKPMCNYCRSFETHNFEKCDFILEEAV